MATYDAVKDLPLEIDGYALEPLEQEVAANFTLRLMQIHFCIIYMSSGLSKLQGGAWWNGNALWGTMANPEFAPLQSGWYLEALRFLGQHRWLFELTMKACVWVARSNAPSSASTRPRDSSCATSGPMNSGGATTARMVERRPRSHRDVT